MLDLCLLFEELFEFVGGRVAHRVEDIMKPCIEFFDMIKRAGDRLLECVRGIQLGVLVEVPDRCFA